MENLGAFLRSRREEKKISLDDLSVRTRIAVRFLKAIEENQFDQIPNQVSAKGFLRNYARALDLDESVVLKQYSDLMQVVEAPPPVEAKEEIPSYIQVKKPDRLPFPIWAVVLVGGAILLLLSLTFLMPAQKHLAPPPPPPPVSEPEPPPVPDIVPAPLPPPPVPEPLPDKPESRPGKHPSPSAAPSPPSPPKPKLAETEISNPLTLSIEAVEPSWIQVTIDGAEIKEALLQPNEKIKWQAKETFLLTVGNAGGIKVNLDGKDLDPLGPSGKVVKDIVLSR